ncbi:MAG: DnaD domain protein [Clostridiaceae bacterium]|nr:DnaD domain protein [Clostridiaceae bacterium]
MSTFNSSGIVLSDTPVPDIFIAEYMPNLSGLAVKLYILALHLHAASGAPIAIDDVGRKLSCAQTDLQTALDELEELKLIAFNRAQGQFTPNDVKQIELSRYFQPRATGDAKAVARHARVNPKRREAISSINQSFFQGIMSPRWYYSIDEWFDRFGFEPNVMYSLFQECADRNKLNPYYVGAVAEDWHGRGIRNYDDLERDARQREKINAMTRLVGNLLNKDMTAFDRRLVNKWVNEFNYDADLITHALRLSTRLHSPNMDYFDKVLTAWHEAGVTDVATARAHQEEFRRSRQSANMSHSAESGNSSAASGRGAAYAGGNRRRKPAAEGNFEQRVYDENFWADFYDDGLLATTDDANDSAAGGATDSVAGDANDSVAGDSNDHDADNVTD